MWCSLTCINQTLYRTDVFNKTGTEKWPQWRRDRKKHFITRKRQKKTLLKPYETGPFAEGWNCRVIFHIAKQYFIKHFLVTCHPRSKGAEKRSSDYWIMSMKHRNAVARHHCIRDLVFVEETVEEKSPYHPLYVNSRKDFEPISNNPLTDGVGVVTQIPSA